VIFYTYLCYTQNGKKMKIENQEKLLALFEKGYSIHINNGYVTEMAYEIAKNNRGEILYSDSVFIDCSLEKIDESDVDVYKPIGDHWDELEIAQLEEA